MILKEECAVCLGNLPKFETFQFKCCNLSVCLECIDAKWLDSLMSIFRKCKNLECPVQ